MDKHLVYAHVGGGGGGDGDQIKTLCVNKKRSNSILEFRALKVPEIIAHAGGSLL